MPTKSKKFVPRKYQKQSIKFLIEKSECGLFLAPGLGKTVCVLTAFNELKKQKKIKTLLIVSKLRIIYDVWPEEIRKWGFDFKISILHGPKKEDRVEEDADVYLLNYEGLEWLGQKIKSGHRFDWVVYDESSKIKNTKTKRFKTIKKISNTFKRRTILTGSPAPNSLKDVFGQIYAIDMGKTLGPYITKFLIEYFYPSGYMGYDWKLMPGAEERIYAKLRPLVLRFGLDQIPELPKLIINDVYVELPEKAREIYKEVEKEFIYELKEGAITAANAGVKSQKLRQIASGNVYNEHGKAVWVHEAKVEVLINIVEELQGSPCLIAFEFKHELDSVLAQFPDTPYIAGGVSPKRGTEIKDAWNKGELPLLLCQYESVAYGLNLQDSGHNIIMYSFTWNLENYEQLILRIRRSGQKSKHVILHRIIAKSTIDDKVMLPTIDRKDKTQQSFLKAMENTYMSEKTSEEKFALSDNKIKIKILKNHIEEKNMVMPVYYWGAKNSDMNFITDLIKLLSVYSEAAMQDLLKALGEEPGAGKKLVQQLKDVIFKIFKIKKVGKTLEFEDDLLLKEAASTVKDVTGEYDKSTNEEPTMGDFKTPKKAKSAAPAEATTKKPAAKKTTAKKTTAKKPAAKKTTAKKTTAKKTTAKKTTAKKPTSSAIDTKKLIAMMSRKDGASVADMADAVDVEEVKVRGVLGRLRSQGSKIKSMGKGVFKIGK